ncbi:MAG: hypothetical protein IGS54_07295 [Elainella sp. C42_A2020_010]|nr:hypothetical protein [Elainella sp. C42_A2020_010]RNJ67224.1 MAG: hypothetical protein EDM05_21815 [Leptolyngbya sp. IPPAS B-1204]
MSTPSKLKFEQINRIVDSIVKIKRQKNQLDLQQDITMEEREAVIIDALGTYKFLSEKSIKDNGKILVEYRRGISKIIEEIVLFEC